MNLHETDTSYETKLEEFGKLARELREYIKRQANLKTGVFTATAGGAVPIGDLEEKN
jgi:hypothetical protein